MNGELRALLDTLEFLPTKHAKSLFVCFACFVGKRGIHRGTIRDCHPAGLVLL